MLMMVLLLSLVESFYYYLLLLLLLLLDAISLSLENLSENLVLANERNAHCGLRAALTDSLASVTLILGGAHIIYARIVAIIYLRDHARL